ncbi:MAG: type II toxin-antitoxin system VapB family antitoxin [Rhodoluna sp.]
MATSKIFYNNTTQAVRLPKDVAFPDSVSELDIIVLGENRVLVPKGTGWQWWREHAAKFGSDFSVDRSDLLPVDDVNWGDV